jgi:hypothetical protein
MISSIVWVVGTVGYYAALVVWIIAQRTHYFHGKYSHSWMIGTLLLIFGAMQIGGAYPSTIALAGLVSLMMPLIVTAIDISDHRKEGRGLFGHHPHCWMESKFDTNTKGVPESGPSVIITPQALDDTKNWSSR